ncbi:c-type cytochrome [Pseudoroseicyclus sp. H15]
MIRSPLRLLPALGLALMAGTGAFAQDTAADEPLVGDPERGKVVYQSIGYCVDCHGWAGDGKTGRNPRSPDAGANLRETYMYAEDLVTVVRCGRPATEMPFHESPAYRDDRCYGLTEEDLGPDTPPRGHTFRPVDAENVVAYMQEHMIGLGEPTFDECIDYYGEGASACDYLADK